MRAPFRTLAALPPPSLDRRLYQFLNGLPHSASGDQHMEIVSDLGKGAGWAAAAAWLAVLGGGRGRRAGLAATAAMLVGIGLSQGLIKRRLRRRRPFSTRVLGGRAVVVGPRPNDPSFPSGHTSGSFAAASALAAFYPRQAPMLLIAAGSVGLSRVYLGHHFPSDVAAGAGIGAGLGLLAGALAGAAQERSGHPE